MASLTPLDRFLSSIKASQDGCWMWQKSRHPRGYGYFWDGHKLVKAHRWAFMNIGGHTLSDDSVIDHLCRNASCVNPAHLEATTQKTNVLRGTAPAAKQAQQTHCIHGHVLIGPNVYIKPNGARQCVPCRRQTDLRRYARRREAKRVAFIGTNTSG